MPLTKAFTVAMSTLGITGTGAICTYETIRPKNIKDQLIWESLEILNTQDNNDSSEWQKIIGNPPTNNNDEGLKKFIERNKDGDSSEPVDENKLKSACGKVFPKKNEGQDLEDARKYCVKKKQ